MKTIRIPQKTNHPVISDNLTRYYHYPLLRHFFLRRLTMALDFLGKRHFSSILEIGFGNGVLLPELAERSAYVCGIDIHDSIPKVKEMLLKENVAVSLLQGDILNLPYKDKTFDCVISIATLEHIKNLSGAISEVKRVLKKYGVAVFGFPVANKFSDLLLVLTGSLRVYRKKLKEIHPSTHNDILSEAKRQFKDLEIKRFPSFLPPALSLYCSCKGIKSD